MTISIFGIQLLSLESHACSKQLVTFCLGAARFALNSCDSCLLVIGLLRTCLFLIVIHSSRARFVGLSTRKAMSHRVRHIAGHCPFFVCASSFVTSSDFYFSNASLSYFWNAQSCAH
jgi:hypothetical protein